MGRYLTLLGLLCALVGCDTLGDPYRRPGTFALDDSNEDNLRAMAANPADLGDPCLGLDPPDAAAHRHGEGIARQLVGDHRRVSRLGRPGQ